MNILKKKQFWTAIAALLLTEHPRTEQGGQDEW